MLFEGDKAGGAMAKRWVHYESAFEDLLRSYGRAYVAINESKRPIFSGLRVKSFDFVLHNPWGVGWLCDVKGRRVKVAENGRLGSLQTWVSQDDLDGLQEWQTVFGPQFVGMFVFAYWLDAPAEAACPARHFRLPWPDDPWRHRARNYLFRAVRVRDFLAQMRPRSAKWKTYAVPLGIFREISLPVQRVWQTHAEGPHLPRVAQSA